MKLSECLFVAIAWWVIERQRLKEQKPVPAPQAPAPTPPRETPEICQCPSFSATGKVGVCQTSQGHLLEYEMCGKCESFRSAKPLH